jgi:prepilin-type N-terminal cleavage/methylation domain-containing protein
MRHDAQHRHAALRPGFTLIELVVVMVIGLIILGWAMGRIDLGEMRIRSAEQQLSSSLLSAQQRAVLKQHDVRVLFDTAATALLIHEDLNNDGVRGGSEPVRMVELAEGVRLTGTGTPGNPPAVSFDLGSEGLPVLTFHRGGFGSESGLVHLGTVRSARGERPADARRLEVNRATGRVTRSYLNGGVWRRHRS